MVILRVLFEMSREFVDFPRNYADLNSGRAGVFLVFLMFGYNPCFYALRKHYKVLYPA